METPKKVIDFGDDDEDKKKPIKPSPFGKRSADRYGKKGAKKAKKGGGEIKVIHAKVTPNPDEPTAGTHGFVVMCDGYAEKLMTDPMYERTSASNLAFLQAVNPEPRVVQVFNPDGTKKMRSNGYQHRGLVIMIPTENVATTDRDAIVEWINQYLIPAIRAHPNCRDDGAPVMSEDDDAYTVVEAWNDVLSDEDIRALINISWKEEVNTPILWMKASQNNLYSMYHRGRLTEAIKDRYLLVARDMDRIDAINLGLITQATLSQDEKVNN